MKRISLFIFLAAAVLFYAKAYAHAPSKIDLTFDPQTSTLKAVIWHDVDNPQTHFIKRVDIGLKGRKLVTQEFLEQDNQNTETDIYSITEAKPGDYISVEAFCSIAGSLKEELEVR